MRRSTRSKALGEGLSLALFAGLAASSSGCDAGCDATLEAPAASPRALALAAENGPTLARFASERAADPRRVRWLALVPGTSEQWGHHRAPPAELDPDGTLLSDEFRARLERAHALLRGGAVRFLLLSGGSVDPARPDYNEARRGYAFLLRAHAAEWTSEPLAQRLLLDPLAQHSTTNVRNGALLAAELGLPSLLVVTTLPRGAMLSVGDFTTQGFYLLYHDVSGFDAASLRDVGYTLGTFALRSLASDPEPALEQCQLPRARLLGDAYGP